MANCWFCYQDAGTSSFHEKCSKRFFGTAKVPELELNNKLLKTLGEQTINERIAVTGVQPKLSVTLKKTKEHNRLTIVGLWGEYILKPQHPGFPEMPQSEDLTMHLASLFKMPTCDHTLMEASDGSLVYLARRFDRVKGHKVHMEDFCQLSEFLTENKYKGSYEKIGKLILKYCTQTGFDALTYFEMVLFSFLTGNNDMHLKNFSVLYGDEGVSLSPAYDLLNVNLVNPQDDEELALTINGKKKRIGLSDFDVLARSMNIPETAVRNTYNKFSSGNKEVGKMIEASFLSPEKKALYLEIWNKKQRLFN
ncbi:serine/threonine-protein kinase HipA [Mucilaginibacter sp. OK268]|uniref:HipA domain-containing protein n=1 Tax=Mucilaginibacter sp. OK268 TaxID=1881048 RepID=UPI0008812D31|nr:HipA domain-containing protein [Mucilaginibacter sp. OK268]SDP09167.1 serine/threonine-protein kinase HipA [Mucilaginibacter sp. OK268]